MLITEEAARQKWCPMSRMDGDNGPYNRFEASKGSSFTGLEGNFCLGSQCMVWGWIDNDFIENRKGHCAIAGRGATAE